MSYLHGNAFTRTGVRRGAVFFSSRILQNKQVLFHT